VKQLFRLDAKRADRACALLPLQAHQLRLDFHGVTVGLATNSKYLADHVRLGYGLFESPAEGTPDVQILTLEAGVEGTDTSLARLFPERVVRDHLVLPTHGDLVYVLRDRELMAYYTTMSLFSSVVISLRRRYACVHAATVSRDGRAVILCGAARCGKTSLTALLIARGYDYSSDDVTLLGRDSLEVMPFPRALNVRDEYFELMPALLAGARRVGRFRVADQERLIVELSKPARESVQPAAVCFPSYDTGQVAELTELSKADAVAGLMQNRFHPLGEQADSEIGLDLSALAELAERCACYRLRFSDPVAASDLVAERLLLAEGAV
jgi:hypothetical protein